MMSVDEKFRQAKENVGKLSQEPGNDVKLKMYALFKQVRLLHVNQGIYSKDHKGHSSHLGFSEIGSIPIKNQE